MIHFAVVGIDYENVTTILTFPECANKSCVRITILDDMTVERRQTFTISLENIDSRITLDRDSVDGEVTIMDNEGCMYCMYGTFQCSIYLSPVLSSPSVALVTLNRTEYNVIEGNLRLSVCATIQYPDPNEVRCPVDFPFSLIFLSREYSAGTLMMIQCTLSVGDCLFLLRVET